MTAITAPATRISTARVAARIGWFVVWAFVTAFAWFEVVKQGYIEGSAVEAAVLTTVAVGAFVLPDMTFFVGVGQPVEKGYLPTKAVPSYNAMHRIWPPLLLTTAVGIGLAPLGPVTLALFIGGLSWMAHVALDRAAGYGLRNADGSR
jgi:hypothetical protein